MGAASQARRESQASFLENLSGRLRGTADVPELWDYATAADLKALEAASRAAMRIAARLRGETP